MNLFQMSEGQLERARESWEDRMYRLYYGSDIEPTCEDCTHFCPASKNRHAQCERFNDDESSEDYGEYYVDVNPDDDACDDFEAEECDDEPEYEPEFEPEDDY